jgi:FG-GAP-like repeat/FG-GAP repeat
MAAVAAGAVLAAAGTAWADFVAEPGSPYPVGNDPLSIYAGDLNGDGRPDVVTMNGTSSDVSVFMRQPAGGFAQEAGSPIAVGSAPSGVAIGDFNGDHLADLAVSAFGAGNVAVLLRRPADDGFGAGQTVAAGVRLDGIAAGDFNGDGLVDLAVSEYDAARVALLLGDGGGGFTLQGTTYATGTQPAAMTSADFNGDGVADVAVANNSGNSVTVLLGVRGGGLAPEATIPVGTQPAGLAAADFDGDGRTDLAISDYTPGAVTILLRRATDDGFNEEAGSPVPVSAGPVGIAAADFDRDGRPDVAVATNAGAIDVLRRNAGGGFTRLPATQVGGVPNGIAAADFNGDGRPDVVYSQRSDSTFSALLNPAPLAPPPPVPSPTPTPTPLPTPVAGKTVNLLPVSGRVTLRRPGSKTYARLTAGAQIPVGSSVDTRAGRVTIVAAQGKGKTASADFSDGLFTLTQTKGSKPLTTLTLTEKLGCPRAGRASAAARKPKSRKLWGDGSGSFRTRGQYSAATVRGTRWLTQDTCGATLTRVAKGVVSVRDEVEHRTVIVRAGHRYTARRR